MSESQSIPDTSLGFTPSELQLLRQQQQVLAQRSHQGGPAERGRGTSRHSVPSSRDASAASTQSVQRVSLDPRSLASLDAHLSNVIRNIQSRIDQLQDALDEDVRRSKERARRGIEVSDAEIARTKRIIRELDDLDDKFDDFKTIKTKVKTIKARVDAASDRLDRSRPTNQSGSRPGAQITSSRHDRR